MSEEQWTLELALKRVLAHEATIDQQQTEIDGLNYKLSRENTLMLERSKLLEQHIENEAQQQARIDVLKSMTETLSQQAEEYKQALAAERERAESLERQLEVARFNPVGDNHHNAWACPHCRSYVDTELQAEREKSARLEAEIADLKDFRKGDGIEAAYRIYSEARAENTRLEALAGLVQRYEKALQACRSESVVLGYDAGNAAVVRIVDDTLTTQAPEADHVGGLMSIPAYQQREAPEAGQ